MNNNHPREQSLLFVLLLLLPLLILVPTVSSGDDFYDLLGIGRQANNREIRRAFKKLALKMHPDKNQVADWLDLRGGRGSRWMDPKQELGSC